VSRSAGRRRGNRQRARGARVLCVAAGRVLLVQHEDSATGERFWLLPGGGREYAETLAAAAARETLEETGVPVRVVRRLRGAAGPGLAQYALFLAEPVEPAAPGSAGPTVDLTKERFLRAAGWHPITVDRPLGPLDPDYWAFLAPLLRRLAAPRQSRSSCSGGGGTGR
jgi:8-oxo-dGTP pyrophosphatase MutT (NUDIX family)